MVITLSVQHIYLIGLRRILNLEQSTGQINLDFSTDVRTRSQLNY
jgi:hypothetical protein